MSECIDSNELLSIVIPTYNRAQILEENLQKMLPNLKKYNINIYISDDSTNDDTEIFVKKMALSYNNIFYYRNHIPLGHDENCIYSLSLPTSKYVWYLGDAIIIRTSFFDDIIKLLKSADYDYVCMNADGRDLNVESQLFVDKKSILSKIGWHLTYSGVTIYSAEVLKRLSIDLNKTRNFPQLALIYKAVKDDIRLFWINSKVVYSNPNKVSYWGANLFDIFINDLRNLLIYCGFSESDATFGVRDHAERTGVFSYYMIAMLRKNNKISVPTVVKFKSLIQEYTSLNFYFACILAALPVGLLKRFFLLKS